jgi:periplasmic protein TonB
MNDPVAPPAPSAVRPVPKIGPSERLSATTVLSLVAFGVLILGVAFRQDEAAPVVPTLDVILTQTSTPEAPKQADFLAQSNNQGGGNSDKVQRPREDQSARVPKTQPGVAPQALKAQVPPPAPDPRQRLLTTVGASPQRVAAPEEHPDSTPRPLPTGQQLIEQSAEMARLAAEIEISSQLYARRPKKKFITASTQEYEYAAYMRAWVAKVERIGNLNYPREAQRLGLTGRLILTVSIGRNGEVKGVLVNRSSGKKLLDAAAVQAVNLASPFAPLPQTSEDIDILDITRTWDYRDGSVDTN